MRRKPIYLLFATLVLTMSLCSCKHASSVVSEEHSDTLQLLYARNLLIIEHDDYTEVQIANPWSSGTIMQTYEIRQPFTHAAIFIAAHAALIDELGCLDAIAGVCEPEYIADKNIHEGISKGSIANLGSAMVPDKESIINLSPDAILLSPFENVGSYSNLEQLGLPIIQCSDYMEPTALGRAEWIRFYGRLFGCAELADSLFDSIAQRYHTLCEAVAADSTGTSPTVMFDTRNGSAWYMPGGQSTLASLVRDAGGSYIFADDTHSGSIPLSFETVFDRGQDADVWFIRYSSSLPLTLSQLRSMYAPYAKFKAFNHNGIYACNNKDLIFYEETPFHPDRLLHDFIKILRPQALSSFDENEGLRYFQPLSSVLR
ncbi:MAG: ABC transporter substrate-binding protein [Bacteroidaceae bacterium]|nr:ABC transporter substrate-binding protein [Bacteroidaceae bacterium]